MTLIARSRRYGTLVVAIGSILLILFLVYPGPWESDRVTRLTRPPAQPTAPADNKDKPTAGADNKGKPTAPAKDADHPSKPQLVAVPSAPAEYSYAPPLGDVCINRFSQKYLEHFRDHAVSYCEPESRSQVTCFHSNSRSDGQIDSMCLAQGADFDAEAGKFTLRCRFRKLSDQEQGRGLIPFIDMRPYWYDTGIPHILKAAINLYSGGEEEDGPIQLVERQEKALPTGPEHETPKAPPRKFPRNYLLVKREGEGNPWHCMMEIFSSYMAMDVLRMSGNQANNGNPYFSTPKDADDTQVVILDDRPDGPYMEAWTLFAKHKPVRLHELRKDHEAIEHIKRANIIMPLAGGSNPLWQPEEEVRQCTSAPTVSVFATRMLSLYGVDDPPPRKPTDPIVVTFIDRKSRRLVDQAALFAELQERYPYTSVRLVDFAAMSFKDQLRTVRETDILVGVHGAGLTHSIFMRENVGAVVEIQPREVDYFGFRMVATMRGLSYFRTHGDSVPRQDKRSRTEGHRSERRTTGRSMTVEKRDGWHWDDVRIEPERFFELMDVAIKSMYSKGVWDHPVNKL